MVNITCNLCTRQGDSSIDSAVYNQERVIIARVRYSMPYQMGRKGLNGRVLLDQPSKSLPKTISFFSMIVFYYHMDTKHQKVGDVHILLHMSISVLD